MGPLHGIRVVELKGIGPGPYATMLLADMGAEVITVERGRTPNSISVPAKFDMNSRSKRSIALNLKTPEGVKVLLDLIANSDMLVEGYRPGVAEKLGFGPEVCHAKNPQLIYGRITGWGQYGPLAKTAGHDINYISLTGALAAIGDEKKPIPPLNLVGDYAGGSLFLVMGMLAALHNVAKTGQGEVVDAAITDGAASLMGIAHSMGNLGLWSTERGTNMLDGAAHFYRAYETADAKFVSIGSIEPQFYTLLVQAAGLDAEQFSEQYNQEKWAELATTMEQVFKTKTQSQWCDIMEGTDICFAPVLDFTEAPSHPHNQARETYINIGGVEQPAPAPKLTNSPLPTPTAPVDEGSDTDSILKEFGYDDAAIAALDAAGALPK